MDDEKKLIQGEVDYSDMTLKDIEEYHDLKVRRELLNNYRRDFVDIVNHLAPKDMTIDEDLPMKQIIARIKEYLVTNNYQNLSKEDIMDIIVGKKSIEEFKSGKIK